ncbi:MAG TPA: transposase [Gaiellales bacterium]|nr:transposase [Gaiellales bacterium]
MAMGPAKGQAATLQIEMVCLDELVPADDRLRGLDELVDWRFVRAEAAPYYAADVGRPSIDPIVLVKLMLVGALEGIGSMRELLRVASMRVDVRRFLGYGFTERLPVHQTISHAQTRRFVDAGLFERLFLRSVALCRAHGLIDGSHLSVDGFHVEANAALASLRASLEPVADVDDAAETVPPATASTPEPGADADAGARTGPRAQLVLAEPRSGPTPRRRSSNATTVSRTDPDAKLRGKPGQRPHLVYRGQIAVDPKARCIVACRGETADGHEGDALAPIIQRARFACPELESVGADQGFAGEQVWKDVAALGVIAYVPPQRTMLPAPGEEPRTDAKRAALAARQRCKTPTGVWAHIRRMCDAEGGVAELKNEHGLDRARCRGTNLFHVQLLLGCTALNVKRLASRSNAASGQAAESATAQADSENAASDSTWAADRAHNSAGAHHSAPGPIVHAARATWTISPSMN